MKMKNIKFGLSFLLLGSLVACGPKSSDQVDVNLPLGISDKGSTRILPHDSSCVGVNRSFTLGTQKATILLGKNNVSPILQDVDLSSVTVDENGIHSDFVERVYFTGHNVNDGAQLRDNIGNPLYFCPESASFGSYSKDSVEGEAINALYAIKLAGDFYKQLNIPNKKILDKLELIIQPISIVIDEFDYMTENAFYADFSGTAFPGHKKVIAVMPESTAYYQQRLAINDASFVQAPSVLAHEYGHFIVSHYLPRYTKGESAAFRDNFISKSFNEAFADLYSQAVVGENNFNLTRIMEDRSFDILNFKIFGMTVPKTLSVQTMQKFDLYPEEHFAGSVIAYNVNKLMETLIDQGSIQVMIGDNKSLTKAKLLMSWLSELELNESNLLLRANRSNELSTILGHLLRVLEKNANPVRTKDISNQAKIYFPFMASIL